MVAGMENKYHDLAGDYLEKMSDAAAVACSDAAGIAARLSALDALADCIARLERLTTICAMGEGSVADHLFVRGAERPFGGATDDELRDAGVPTQADTLGALSLPFNYGELLRRPR